MPRTGTVHHPCLYRQQVRGPHGGSSDSIASQYRAEHHLAGAVKEAADMLEKAEDF